jgi:hypothetical protein
MGNVKQRKWKGKGKKRKKKPKEKLSVGPVGTTSMDLVNF